MNFGNCSTCGAELEAVWFTEMETKVAGNVRYQTRRKRQAVDYLICPCCLSRFPVDDSFDGSWHY